MTDTDNKNIPQHIAIIPDGNRRWAKERGLPATEGHREGAKVFEKLLEHGNKLGVKAMTFWAFSTENWNRSEQEINLLFELLRELLKDYKEKFLKEEVRFFHLGRKDRLPKDIVESILDLESSTKEFDEKMLGIAIDYGGHDELKRTFEKIEEKGLEVTDTNIEGNLDTAGMPRVDFIIRTSGEQRFSGFLPWQSEYAEFYFPEYNFPDFTNERLEEAIKIFSNRERRFGGDSKKSS